MEEIKKNNAQDIIEKNYDKSFDILSIQKEMEIENIFLTDQNIKDLKDLNSGYTTVDELVSKAFKEISNDEKI